MTQSEFKDKPLLLRIEPKFAYWFFIILILLLIFFFAFFVYKDWVRGDYDIINLLLTIGLIFFLYKILSIKKVLLIELYHTELIIKHSFGDDIDLKYNQIDKVNIYYDITFHTRNPHERIVVWRKRGHNIQFSIERNKINLREDSEFLQCINFLSTKIPVTIHIHNDRKKYIDKDIIKAKLKWSNNPYG